MPALNSSFAKISNEVETPTKCTADKSDADFGDTRLFFANVKAKHWKEMTSGGAPSIFTILSILNQNANVQIVIFLQRLAPY